jgi:hypothetical protein
MSVNLIAHYVRPELYILFCLYCFYARSELIPLTSRLNYVPVYAVDINTLGKNVDITKNSPGFLIKFRK